MIRTALPCDFGKSTYNANGAALGLETAASADGAQWVEDRGNLPGYIIVSMKWLPTQ